MYDGTVHHSLITRLMLLDGDATAELHTHDGMEWRMMACSGVVRSVNSLEYCAYCIDNVSLAKHA